MKSRTKTLMALSAKIRRLRLERNLSKAEFALLIKEDLSTVKEIESGESDLKISTIEKIINALKIHVSDLFK
jgi:transcriptional regulator with XRE-family HTH domain